MMIRKKIIFIEAAVLIEAGWNNIVNEVWVVAVNRNIAITRLCNRNNLSIEDANKRIKSQISNEERLKYADKIIWNDESLEELQSNVEKVFEKYA